MATRKTPEAVASRLEDPDPRLRWAAAYYLARVTATARLELAEHAAKLFRLVVDRARPPGAPDAIAAEARIALGAALAVTKRRAAFVEAAREVDAELALAARKVFRKELRALFPDGIAAIPRAPGTRRKDRIEAHAALLAAVHADLADDAPRLVYADALLEAGDVRGEHIVLQCERARTKAPPTSRELLLERTNGRAWVGPAGAWLTALRYERGFLVAGAHGGRGATIAPEAASDPVWITVEELDVARGTDVVGFLSGPLLRSLRKVTGLLAQDFVRVTGRDLQHVGLRRVDVAPSRVVAALAKHPRLETLDLGTTPEPELMLLAAARLPQLRTIAFGRRRYERAGEGWRPARRDGTERG